MNELLSLRTFVIGNNLSAADIALYVILYQFYAKIDDKQRYQNFLNISRWFDMVQFNIKSYSNLLSPISIKKSVPAPKKSSPKKDKKKKKSTTTTTTETK